MVAGIFGDSWVTADIRYVSSSLNNTPTRFFYDLLQRGCSRSLSLKYWNQRNSICSLVAKSMGRIGDLAIDSSIFERVNLNACFTTFWYMIPLIIHTWHVMPNIDGAQVLQR